MFKRDKHNQPKLRQKTDAKRKEKRPLVRVECVVSCYTRSLSLRKRHKKGQPPPPPRKEKDSTYPNVRNETRWFSHIFAFKGRKEQKQNIGPKL